MTARGKPVDFVLLRAVILQATPLALPLVVPGAIWLHSLLPLVVAYHHVTLARRQGRAALLIAILLAVSIALAAGRLPLLLFGGLMIPLGLIIGQGVRQGQTPTWTGVKGLAYLASLWLLLGLFMGGGDGTTPYQALRQSLDQGLAAVIAQGGKDLPAEAARELEAALAAVRELLTRALPGLFFSSLLSTVWFNLAMSHWLLKQHRPEAATWPDFRHWRLPEILIWPLIGAGLSLLLPSEALTTIGLNLLLVLGLLYFMQGVAIMTALLAHWRLPPLLRGLLYALVIFQVYGIILVAGLGIADVWLDFRHRLQARQREEP